ncbi:hypothetical protein VNO80_30246 [Phaseolus coccineus]|uniref:DUF4408 domain-containing protein n=1 Tax=Phaseolus coccineus TaxID=3886 RepID=A0AAN9LFN9_PHACN
MNKFKKSQVLVLCLLVVLLVITPSLPSSLRPTYLYFIINFLIMALCAEAGLLSVFSRPSEDKKQSLMPPEATSEKREGYNSTPIVVGAVSEHAEKSASERVVCVTKVDMVQSCPSMPSLFITGGGETDEEVMDEELEAEEEMGGVNGQELFAKAEAFIGNFYKQLKMQIMIDEMTNLRNIIILLKGMVLLDQFSCPEEQGPVKNKGELRGF